MIKLFAVNRDNNLYTEYIRYTGKKKELDSGNSYIIYGDDFCISQNSYQEIQISSGCSSKVINMKLGDESEEPNRDNGFIMTVTNFRFDYLKRIVSQESVSFPGYTIGKVLQTVQLLKSVLDIQERLDPDYVEKFIPLSIDEIKEVIEDYKNNKFKVLSTYVDVFKERKKSTVTPSEESISEIDELKLKIEILTKRMDTLFDITRKEITPKCDSAYRL